MLKTQSFSGAILSSILQHLYKLSEDQTLNGKRSSPTFSKNWKWLTQEQREKTLEFWKNNISSDILSKIMVDAKYKIHQQQEIQRDMNRTTKHDLVFLFPSALILWQNAIFYRSSAFELVHIRCFVLHSA